MRNFLLAFAISASACSGSRPVHTTLPVHYACGDATIVHTGATLQTKAGATRATRGWHDDEGDHYVTWPVSPTEVEATEYVVPGDPHADAMLRVYDTSKGTSKVDWRLVKRDTCTAQDGYTNALTLYMKGASIKEVAKELSADDDHARELVRAALISLQKKYLRERR